MAASSTAAVIVMAAGKGTRMRSVTPKVLHTIGGRSLLGHALEAARGLEPQRLVVVVRHEREAVVSHLADIAPDAVVADQDEIPGTGRAVACGLAALPADLDGAVVVTSGDVPLLDTATLTELVEQHRQRGDVVTVLTAELADPSGYGRVIRAGGQDPLAVAAIVEHRDATEAQRAVTEVNAGVYAFDIAFLRRTLETLGTDNDQGEVYLTDVIEAAYSSGRSTSALRVRDHWLVEGCNDRAQLAQLGAELNRRVLARWMEQGVGVVDPRSTWVDVTVTLSRDVHLEPGVLLRGRTSLGEGTRVGAYSILTDVTVPAGAVVAPMTQLDADPVGGSAGLVQTDGSVDQARS